VLAKNNAGTRGKQMTEGIRGDRECAVREREGGRRASREEKGEGKSEQKKKTSRFAPRRSTTTSVRQNFEFVRGLGV
jgi:hypothetical protein